MPRQVRINGRLYDITNVPPWYEHVVAAVEDAPTDEQQRERMEQDAAAAEQEAQQMHRFIPIMIMLTGLAALVILGILIAGVLT